MAKWKFLSSLGEENKLMKYFLSEAFDIYWKRRVKRENKKNKKKNEKFENESKFSYTFYKCGRFAMAEKMVSF